jgi:hypothetical protein
MLSETHVYIFAAALMVLLLTLISFYIHKDYYAFLNLGPGGTPQTPLGYLKIKLLSLICLRDSLCPIKISPHFRPQQGYFSTDALAKREGERPVVRGIAPQRQQTQKSDKTIYGKLVKRSRALAAESKNRLTERTSCFEKHSTGLFTSKPLVHTCDGEILHAHPSDGSLHMTLHPADVNLIIEYGWGERHPLARGGWCRKFVPREFVLVYAPRDEAEVDILIKIIAAGVWWVSGIDINGEESISVSSKAKIM